MTNGRFNTYEIDFLDANFQVQSGLGLGFLDANFQAQLPGQQGRGDVDG